MPTTRSSPTGQAKVKDPTDIEQSDLGPIQASGTILTPDDIDRIRMTNPSVEINVTWAPEPKQVQVLQSIKAKEIFIGWAKRSGKAQPLSSLVSTPYGFMPMRRIHEGSLVSNPSGGVAQVIGVFPQGFQDIYELEFSDGATCRTTLDHLWLTRTTGVVSGKVRRVADDGTINDWRIRTTRQILDFVAYQTVKAARSKLGVQIPLSNPVEYYLARNQEFPIDPYGLGLLLGDGGISGRKWTFTSDDEFLLREFEARLGVRLSQDEGCSWFLTQYADLRSRVESLGLDGKLSYEKFIPKNYLNSPISVRAELLRGLMDTDGYISNGGHCSFASSSLRLAQDVQWLARSLGWKATLSSGKAGYKTEDGTYVQCRDSHDVYLAGRAGEEIFKLERKRSRSRPPIASTRTVESVRFVRKEKAQCIQVDHPNSLYITDDFIVTHNTELSRAWMVKGNTHKKDYDHNGQPILVNMSYVYHPHFLGVVIRKNEKDLADWVERAKPFYATLGGRFIRNPAEFKFNSGARIFLGHAEDKNAWTKYAGQSIVRMFVDEAGQIPDLALYDQLLSCVRSDFPEMIAQILLAANPGGPGQDWLVNRFCEPKDRDGNILINPISKRPYSEEETSRGDLIYEKVSIPVELRSPDDPEFEWSVRQWIEMKMSDNKYAMRDRSYIISLASITDPKLRNAYLLGHYKALRGTYFDIFSKSTHTVPKEYPLSVWWQTAGSLDWGFVHEAAAYKSKRNPQSGQLVVYGEMCVSRTDPVELGASLAHWWMPELQYHQSVRLYVSHDLFHNKIGEYTWADLIEKGVKKVLGPDSCWVPDLVAQKLKASMAAQGRTWTEEIENSLRYRKTRGLILLRAPSSRSVGFMHVRSLMRLEPLPGTNTEGFSWDIARKLWIDDGEEAYQKYIDLYRKVAKEILPELLISLHCPRLIEALPKAIHDPDKPEDVDDTHFYGMDSIDSLRYLCTGVRDDRGKGEPDDIYRQRRVDEALSRNPSLTTPDLIWIHREIEAELDERNSGQDGFNLPRRSRALRYAQSDIVQ